MSKIIVPAEIVRLIDLILTGKNIPKKKVKEYSKEEYLSMALKNLVLLQGIPKIPVIKKFLNSKYSESGEKRSIVILSPFSKDWDPKDNSASKGALYLCDRGKGPALYFHFDADFPANRSERDYTLVTSDNIQKWHQESIKIFAKLTERQIWDNIRDWLKIVIS
ncbi:MAG: hypothetical protein WDK96_03590 [Candidatus Paceibacterota bacterium]|jgi:hypothetical protein